LKADSKVRKPTIKSLASLAPRDSSFRSQEAGEETIFDESCRRAKFFKDYATVFRTELTLQELESRKNSDAEAKAAERKAKRLASKPTRYSSARWVDAKGVPLAFYLSSRMVDNLKQTNECNKDEEHMDVSEDGGTVENPDLVR